MTYSKSQNFERVCLSDHFTDADVDNVRNELDWIVIKGESNILLDLSGLTSFSFRAAAVFERVAKKIALRRGMLSLIYPKDKALTKKVKALGLLSTGMFNRDTFPAMRPNA
ncbi:STAS domain-containing protein [Aliikangiella marina]|uniref:STAS domain-containing protein n=1 Tax=Aliikangiella marina TaxID=1712262 RepID=A0A545T994_9GAMM|nr:STAS domain-containing protein [Aliikangiella marina]TQV73782.1 STAS domain-containing protein [Aliikangiella marina]